MSECTGESPLPKRLHVTTKEPSRPVVEGASMGQAEIGKCIQAVEQAN